MQIYKSLYYLLEVRQYFFGKTRVGAAKHRLFFVYIDTISHVISLVNYLLNLKFNICLFVYLLYY